MERKEAKEIIKAGFEWANWTNEQREAFHVAYQSMEQLERLESQIKHFESLISIEYSQQFDNVERIRSQYQKGALEGMKNYNRKWEQATDRKIVRKW